MVVDVTGIKLKGGPFNYTDWIAYFEVSGKSNLEGAL